MDVLAVPNVCGADVMRTSNFSLKPVKLQVLRASERDLAGVPAVKTYASQRTPADFKVAQIRTERELRKDPAYQPRFTNVPIRVERLQIELSPDEYASLRATGLRLYYGDNDGDALRDVLFSWWETHYMM